MDSHKVSVLPERLTVVELGRRRRWSEEEKLRIVMESLQRRGWCRRRRVGMASRARC